jgi:CBS domain-containing protein
MLTLREIMATGVVTVDPDATLREVVDLLVERRISGLPVVSRGRVAGVVSATDLLDAVASSSTSSQHTPQPDSIKPDEEDEWIDENDEPGFYTDAWPGGVDELERFEELFSAADLLEDITAGEVMTRALHVLPPDTPVPDAARYMLDAGIHRVLVADEEGLVGLTTTTDFVKAVADGRLLPGA